jgi:hypothetical protein
VEIVMPIHDWSRIPSGLFHDFHQTWMVEITHRLNRGLLPKDLSAIIEERSRSGSFSTTKQIYTSRANRITIKHRLQKTIAAFEIVSPGNKETKIALDDFLSKTIESLRTGIHLLLIDLFAPPSFEPLDTHQLIWNEIHNDSCASPAGKNRILASYEAGEETVAYVEPIAVGDVLTEMPLFMSEKMYITIPLEETYQAAWMNCPEIMREAVETGIMPETDADLDE